MKLNCLLCLLLFLCFYFLGIFLLKKALYEVFDEDVKEGFTTAVRIIPYLVAMLFVIGIFRASGAIDVSVKSPSKVALPNEFAQYLILILMRGIKNDFSRKA